MGNAWLGLLGAVVGAGIALLGQHTLARATRRHESGLLLVETCAAVIALNEDFRNRLWEERRGLAPDVLAGWDIAAARLATAKARLLTADADLHAALDQLEATGRALGRTWRTGRTDSDELEAAWQANRQAQQRLVEVARLLVARRLGGSGRR